MFSKGAPPTTREYRVNAELELDLPKGTEYSVNPVGDGYEKCVNDRLHGKFTTTRDNETITLWMDASERVINPPCFTLVSYIEWDFVVSSDPTGSHLIYLGQGVNGGPYKTRCEDWYRNKGLHCEEPKQLGLKISR